MKNGQIESVTVGVHRKRISIPAYISQIRMMMFRLAAILSRAWGKNDAVCMDGGVVAG